ncbi:hypothetical protein B0J12DRAFT_87910 [Macrophomina phaseolina]|uniref:Secreted protein n=1 Tax=Macrophomina phaseolina TaxID=35725 RepID=A0ABQ8GAL1_9PEZI|nr:hypothetical protein B0J12DRAFT_87910 [Macrophomina phaseolina]
MAPCFAWPLVLAAARLGLQSIRPRAAVPERAYPLIAAVHGGQQAPGNQWPIEVVGSRAIRCLRRHPQVYLLTRIPLPTMRHGFDRTTNEKPSPTRPPTSEIATSPTLRCAEKAQGHRLAQASTCQARLFRPNR